MPESSPPADYPASGGQPPCSRCVCKRVMQPRGHEVYEQRIGSQVHRFGMLDRECPVDAPASSASPLSAPSAQEREQ